MNNDSDSADTLTSSECTDSSDDNTVENDSETESYRSLTFSVKSNCSTAKVKKSNKSKKRVRFKPGDSLVLIYEIPNRAMLGLKSDSEDSDDDDDDDDSDDSDDSDDEDDDEDNDVEKDEKCDNNKNEIGNKANDRNSKPFAKLISVKQVNRRKTNERRLIRNAEDTTSKLVRLSVSAPTQRQKKRLRIPVRMKEKKERVKSAKKDNTNNVAQPAYSGDNKTKPTKLKRNKFKSLKPDIDKMGRSNRKKGSVLEIKATVDASSSVPKLIYKHDLKPSIIDVNGALTVCGSKQLINRTRMQPTSFRLAPTRDGLTRSCSATSRPERQSRVHQVISASYDTFPYTVEESYVKLQSLQKGAQNDVAKRADPDNMNDEGKRHYAWQIANGNISSQSLRTPSILPFWDSLRSTIAENNAINLPT